MPVSRRRSVDPVRSGVLGQVLQDQPAEPRATELGAHVHALDLPVASIGIVDEEDAAAPGRDAIGPQHEEVHPLPHQALDAEAVPAGGRIEPRQVRLQLRDEAHGVG